MQPSDLTMDFVHEMFEKANMTPRAGFYGFSSESFKKMKYGTYEKPEHKRCGCLVGAMLLNMPDKEINRRNTTPGGTVANYYGIDGYGIFSLMSGFDDGLGGLARGHNMSPWYARGYEIGRNLISEQNES